MYNLIRITIKKLYFTRFILQSEQILLSLQPNNKTENMQVINRLNTDNSGYIKVEQ